MALIRELDEVWEITRVACNGGFVYFVVAGLLGGVLDHALSLVVRRSDIHRRMRGLRLRRSACKS